jgi:hypothetical protein
VTAIIPDQTKSAFEQAALEERRCRRPPQVRRRRHVVCALRTNTIEGFWSLIKRGVMGSYHKVSRKYLPLYVAEFQFRYNNRLNADIFGEAIRRC